MKEILHPQLQAQAFTQGSGGVTWLLHLIVHITKLRELSLSFTTRINS